MFNCDGGLPVQPGWLGFAINDKYMIQRLCEGRNVEERGVGGREEDRVGEGGREEE